MTPTRIRTLLLTAVICGAAAYLLLQVLYAQLPPLPWTGLPTLLLLAVAEAWIGRNLRLRLRGRATGVKPVVPIAVARTAALAKATSLAAAVLGGLAAGFLVYVSGSLDKPAYRSDAFASGATLAAAIVLTLAALYLEHSCRVPPSANERGDELSGKPGPPTSS